jgi:uncharacterized protein
MAQAMTLETYFSKVLKGIPFRSAQSVLELSAEGATVPFMARYRKEKTGNLDEVQIREVIDAKAEHDEVLQRQAHILKEIEKQNQLTPDLQARVFASMDLGELEEIYRPFKKKKKTKATVAREAGLEPLANWIWQVGHGELTDTTVLEVKAKEYLNVPAGIVTYELALKGAQDILVERIHNNPDLRSYLRKEYLEKGYLVSKKTKTFKAHSKFEMYADFKDKVTALRTSKASHRYLAMRRGWQESELSLTFESDTQAMEDKFVKFSLSVAGAQVGEFLAQAAKAALNQHVIPSISNEIHSLLKEEADKFAVQVFSENVKRVLLSSPFGAKWVLGVDPGLRTGCKIALVDQSGTYITNTVINTMDANAEVKAQELLKELISRLQAIAVGNGTAGRETFSFFRKVVTGLGATTPVVMVNESGASVYSASDVAREEFPELDVTVRGAISIARRLQDPLAELVKIDPKSIGVGQYQHDVSQTLLKKSLDFVVESCVNKVGVDLNTASEYLLRYVSGIGPALAKNIVEHRKTKGLFQTRDALTKVPHFSTKAYEQAAGFLRIPSSQNPLDRTGIHPERYPVVRDMAQDLGVPISNLIGSGAKKILEHRTKWAELVGEFTFDDMVKELEAPGRDPRDPFKIFNFRDDIHKVSDLKADMICPGIVTNVTNFGAFVDIGVHQDGLVHISELADQFVDDPQKVVSPGDMVTVKVMAVNLDKNQISLSMRLQEKAPRTERAPAREEKPRAQKPRPQPRAHREGEFSDKKPPRGRTDEKRDMRARPAKNFDRNRDEETRDNRKMDPRDQKFRKPAGVPLNNPFASLAGLKSQLKK